jgi:hypothetical protein
MICPPRGALVKLLFVNRRFPCACATSSTHGLGISHAALTRAPLFPPTPPQTTNQPKPFLNFHADSPSIPACSCSMQRTVTVLVQHSHHKNDDSAFPSYGTRHLFMALAKVDERFTEWCCCLLYLRRNNLGRIT